MRRGNQEFLPLCVKHNQLNPKKQPVPQSGDMKRRGWDGEIQREELRMGQ